MTGYLSGKEAGNNGVLKAVSTDGVRAEGDAKKIIREIKLCISISGRNSYSPPPE
ncbi:hypothetical protein [Lacrimispora brassicae]